MKLKIKGKKKIQGKVKISGSKNSALAIIAASILSGAVMEFRKVEKHNDGRAVHYTLEADGHRKERKAVVRKNEEGEWKIEDITDAI